MKQLSKILGPVAVAVAALSASQAYAAGQFAAFATYKGDGTYIGIMDPSFVPTEDSTLKHTAIVPGNFTDFWVFDINPTGNVAGTATFLNIGNSFSAFSLALFKDQAPITNLANARYSCASQDESFTTGVLCAFGSGSLTPVATVTYDPVTGLGTNSGAAGFQTTQFLTAGRYVVRIAGTVVGGSGTYSGDLQVNQIPEPGTLALAGLAMIGAAVSLRKRKTTV